MTSRRGGTATAPAGDECVRRKRRGEIMRIKKYLLTTFLVILLCISIVFMVACQKIITVTLDYGYDNKIETFELSKGEKIQKRTAG